MHEETTKEQVESWDKQYLWHPFTQMKDFVKEEAINYSRWQGHYAKRH